MTDADITYPDIETLPYLMNFPDKVENYKRFLSGTGPNELLDVEHIKFFLSPEENGRGILSKDKLQMYATAKSERMFLMQKTSKMGGMADLVADIMAYLIAAKTLKHESYIGFDIYLDDISSRDPHTVYPIMLMMDRVEDLIDIQATYYTQSPVDHDYLMHIFLAKEFKLMRSFTPQEKLKMMPFRPGSIVTVYNKRGSLSDNSPWGSIQSQYLGRVVGIDKKNLTITLESLQITCTLEDQLADFLNLPIESRALFRDLLKTPPPSKPITIPLNDIGLNLAMFSEPWLITRLSREKDLIKSFVTFDGKLSTLSMSEQDTIYWALKQRGIEFDEDLFFQDNENLTQGKMAWDLTGEDIPKNIVKLAKKRYLNAEEEEILNNTILSVTVEEDSEYVE